VPQSLSDRAARIELLLLDVDGVLTDGSIIYGEAIELKRFHVRDGSGLKFWRDSGKRAAILSGRSTPAVNRRAAELGIDPVIQGRSEKLPAFEELLACTGLDPAQVCAVGDDVPDLPVLRRCGLAIAVADSCAEVRVAADYITGPPGGRGAVRDAIEWLMKLQGTWDGVLAKYH
jgi:3-deoxy-D-manno-octulosonate 8-phosphate phosphatase (KDO 8-P phosphatase)